MLSKATQTNGTHIRSSKTVQRVEKAKPQSIRQLLQNSHPKQTPTYNRNKRIIDAKVPKVRYTTPRVDKDLGYAATKFQSSTPSILSVINPVSVPEGQNAEIDLTTGADNKQLNIAANNLSTTKENKSATKSTVSVVDQDISDEIDKIINVPSYVPAYNGGVTIVGGNTNNSGNQLINVNGALPGKSDAS